QVASQPEARLAPRGDELVCLVPAVEADAERIAAQHAKDFREGGLEPRGIAIVSNSATVARGIVREIRRIGQHEIDATAAESAHDSDAIALQDHIGLWLAENLLALF